ncbi:hypothetical protein [Roseococcus sp.]
MDDQGRITTMGKRMARMGTHRAPRPHDERRGE